jgi:hypothetical protein
MAANREENLKKKLKSSSLQEKKPQHRLTQALNAEAPGT